MYVHDTLLGLFDTPLYFSEETNSVMDDAKSILQKNSGMPSGTVVLADRQTQGRGKYGTTWVAMPGASLTCSVLIHTPTWNKSYTHKNNGNSLALISAYGVLLTIQQMLDSSGKKKGEIQVKWPNDVILQGGKVSGVLVEVYQEWNIIGIGLNVKDITWPEALSSRTIPPISLSSAGIYCTVEESYVLLKRNLEHVLGKISDYVINELHHFLWKKDEQICFLSSDGSRDWGTIRGIDLNGYLVLEQGDTVMYKNSGIIA